MYSSDDEAEIIAEKNAVWFRQLSKGDTSSVEALLLEEEDNEDLGLLKVCRDEKTGKTLLHKAAESHWNIEWAKLLINEVKVDINAADKQGKAPLHVAIECENEEGFQVLLKSGADINLTTSKGETTLDLAKRCRHVNFISDLTENKEERRAAQLHFAVANNLPEDIESILSESHVNLNQSDEEGRTLVHLAASNNSFESLLLLTKYKANLEARDKQKRQPIHNVASRRNGLAVLDHLIQYGSSDHINSQGYRGKTSLYLASAANVVEHVEYLLKAGADANIGEDVRKEMPLHAAARENNYSIVKILCESKKTSVDCLDSFLYSPLFMAAKNDAKDAATVLLDFGADVNLQDKDGNTPMHLAASNGSIGIIKLLNDYGALLDTLNYYGRNPFFKALKSCQDRAAEVLMRLDENAAKNWVTMKDKLGETPLHVCSAKDAPRLAEKLLKMGAEVDAQDNKGRSPAHAAASRNKLDIIQLLLRYGCDLELQDDVGDTPVVTAARECEDRITGTMSYLGCIESMKSELDVGLIVNLFKYDLDVVLEMMLGSMAKFPIWRTSFPQLASNFNSHKCFRMLRKRDYSGDIDSVDSNGYSPLNSAMRFSNYEMVKELLEAGASVKHNFKEAEFPEHIKTALKKIEPEAKKHIDPPIVYAAANNDWKMVQMLVEIGHADVNTMNTTGRNGLFYCVINNNKEMAAYFMHLGGNPFLKLDEYPTAYETAVAMENRDMAYCLINGAFTYQKNHGGVGKSYLL